MKPEIRRSNISNTEKNKNHRLTWLTTRYKNSRAQVRSKSYPIVYLVYHLCLFGLPQFSSLRVARYSKEKVWASKTNIALYTGRRRSRRALYYRKGKSTVT